MSVSIQTSQGLIRVAGNSFNNPMVGATETTDGKAGIVPAPLASEKDYFLRADGTWSKVDVDSDAQANVQSDWNETDSSSDAFIKNKPTSMPASDVHEWAKAEEKPSYTATEVGADSKGSAASALTLAKTYTNEEIEKLEIPSSLSEINDKITELSEKVALIDCEDNETVTDAIIPEGSLHVHDNKDVLDKLSESADGILLFNGNEIQGGTGNVDLSKYATIEFVNNAMKNINLEIENEDIDFSVDY